MRALLNSKLFNNSIFIIAIAILSYSCANFQTVPDVDLWARLAVGSIFFQTGHVLYNDIFSYLPRNLTFIDHEWGSSVIFYMIVKHFGSSGLFFLKFILIFLTLYLISKTIRLNKDVKNINLLIFIILLMPLPSFLFSTIRCQIFTYMFFALWCYTLERVRLGEKRLLWIMPATMILWANLHGGFVVGLGLLLLYAAGEFLNKKNPFPYLLTLLASFAAVLMNPYGYKYLGFIYHALTVDRSFVTEWTRYNFLKTTVPNIQFDIIILLTAAAFAVYLIKRSPKDFVKILVLAATFTQMMLHVRHTTFFAIAALTYFYPDFILLFTLLAEKIQNFLGLKVRQAIRITLKSLTFLFVAYTAYVYCTVVPLMLYVNPGYYPVGSIQFILQNNLKGNVYIPWDWGSYAFWKLYPHNLISTDGRFEEVYNEKIFDEAREFILKDDDYKTKFLKKYHTDVVIVPTRLTDGSYIEKITNWRKVYTDNVSCVFVPDTNKTKIFLAPNYLNEVYLREDYAKPVNLN